MRLIAVTSALSRSRYDRAIHAHIARLRKKIATHGGCESLIRTGHGAGYSLVAKVCAE
ncbi:helix-turn-helix domain-containing protein [Roseovarius sp. BRH_c41]|uniref:winged helix-turn-helix domain-containing protein n=1 Tax=Roseovarius sp. BRH_c41 TaxID=1629709 RepID=UPI0025FACA1B|nr:helix-turn-helix domain-containing protein [Roseovarius sp. BRH_c41]